MVASRQTKLKLRKGFVNAPMHYRVLMVGQFTDEDRKTISKGLITATTPQKAEVLLPGPADRLLPQLKRSKWTLQAVSFVGNFDVKILCYKGLEVAVFFKRQTSIVTPDPEDPAPEGFLQNEDDIWARMDLFSKSPRQLVGSVRQELADKDAEIERLNIEVETLKKAYSVATKTAKRVVESPQPSTAKPRRKK